MFNHRGRCVEQTIIRIPCLPVNFHCFQMRKSIIIIIKSILGFWLLCTAGYRAKINIAPVESRSAISMSSWPQGHEGSIYCLIFIGVIGLLLMALPRSKYDYLSLLAIGFSLLAFQEWPIAFGGCIFLGTGLWLYMRERTHTF